MNQDLVFAIDGIDARLAPPVSLRDVGPPTADSYSEWITQHPELLGPAVRIVATDLRWQSGRGSEEVGIDVLGLGPDGRLVVGVVVVDGEPSQVLMRALTQAAYASRIAPRTLVDMHARYLRTTGRPSDEDTALDDLAADLDEPLQPDVLARPRIVVFAEQLSSSLGTTSVWLDEMGLDITLQRLRAYDAGGQVLVIVSQVFPQESATEMEVVRPRRLQAVAPPEDHGTAHGPDREAGDGFDDAGEGLLATDSDVGNPNGETADVAMTNGFGHGHQQ